MPSRLTTGLVVVLLSAVSPPPALAHHHHGSWDDPGAVAPSGDGDWTPADDPTPEPPAAPSDAGAQ